VLGTLDDWPKAQTILKNFATNPGRNDPLANLKLLAPVLYSSAIYCAGANYQDHANEMAARHNRPPPVDPHILGLESWHQSIALGVVPR
jgi:2-keto-4-pentenoate hydratase/2-oxohepta-3-ene-1,7-dioic acid hydratase in catechol pathway